MKELIQPVDVWREACKVKKDESMLNVLKITKKYNYKWDAL